MGNHSSFFEISISSQKVWLCIVATVIVVAPILNMIHCLSYYYKVYKANKEKGLFQMKNCYWYIYGSLLQQGIRYQKHCTKYFIPGSSVEVFNVDVLIGGIHLPEAISGRLLIGFWWLFVIVVVTTYSGNLVAFLTFPKVESPVNSVEDIINFRGVDSWGFLADSVIADHLKVISSSRHSTADCCTSCTHVNYMR